MQQQDRRERRLAKRWPRIRNSVGFAKHGVLMAAVATGLLGALVASPAAVAAHAPLQASAEIRATKDQCLPKLLQPPRVTRGPVMLNPQKAEVLITARFNAVEGCDSWERLGQFRVQIKQQGRWLDLNGDFWYPTEGSDVPNKNEAHWFGFLDFATHNVHEQCVKGHWEPARWLLRNVVRNAETGKIAATGKIANHPVKFKSSAACSSAASSSATQSLQDRCATEIFKRPAILDNTIYHPGKVSQSININLDFQEVDPACDGRFARLASLLPQLIRHGQVINENPGWTPLLQGRGFNYATKAGFLDFNSANQPDRYWKPGDKVRFMLRLAERNVLTKQVVGTSISVFPITVRHRP